VTDRENTRVQYGLLALPLVVVLIIGGIALIHRAGDNSSSTSTALQVGQSPPASLPTVPAAIFAGQVLGAIRAQPGVRAALTADDDSVQFQVVAYAGRDSGVQAAQIGSQALETRYVGGVLYAYGSSVILQDFAGFSRTAAARASGHWVAIHRTDKPFRSGVQGMTTQDFYTATLGMVGQLKLVGPKRMDGVECIGISGHDLGARTVPETVWVRADGAPLPVVDIAEGSTPHGKIHEVTHFTRWGKPVRVVAPPSSVSYVSLH
jgi:hypothetical protein